MLRLNSRSQFLSELSFIVFGISTFSFIYYHSGTVFLLLDGQCVQNLGTVRGVLSNLFYY